MLRIIFISLVLLFHFNAKGQVVADGLPGCLDPTITMDGTSCGSPNFDFGIIGTEFVVRNIEGTVCCPPPNDGGDNTSYFQFGPIDISTLINVGITMDYAADATAYEDEFPLAPNFACTGTAVDVSHDQIVFTYIVDGTPVEDLYVHGTTAPDFTGTWNSGNVINGSSLIIKIFAANKSINETFRFSNLQVTTEPIGLSAGADMSTCTGAPVVLGGAGTGTWSGGLGIFSDVTDPNSTYTPDPSEDGTVVTLTYSSVPIFAGCPSISDDMQLTVTSPVGSLIGGGILCPGDCSVVMLSVMGGTEPYELDLEFTSSALPVTFPITIPSFTIVETITICYGDAGFLPTFDAGTNTLTLPPLVGGQSGSLSLVSLSDASGCTNVPQNSTINFTFLLKPVASDASLEVCADAFGEGVFDLSQLDNTVINGIPGGTIIYYEDLTLMTPVGNPYIGPSTVLYAVVTDINGCESDPVAITLDVKMNGDAGTITLNCDESGNTDCSICDTDGIQGEDIELIVTFSDQSVNYVIDLVYIINGVQSMMSFSIPGSGGRLPFSIDGDASFQIVSVTPDDDCIDITDMPAPVNYIYTIQPSLDEIPLISDCNPISLPEITGLNITGNGYYNSEPDGTGITFSAGEVFTMSDTIYMIDGVFPDCIDVNQVIIEIGNSVTLIAPPSDTICGFYIFPVPPGLDSSTTVHYYTETTGGGMEFLIGDTIFMSDSIYLFDNNASCPSNEPIFNIEIGGVVDYDTITEISACDFVILPPITGTGVTDSAKYFSMIFGTGTSFLPGDTIFNTDTLYLFDNDIDCLQESAPVVITIGAGTMYDELGILNNCGPYELPIIEGTNIGDSARYYSGPNGGLPFFLPGDTITSSRTLYIFDLFNNCNINQPVFMLNIIPEADYDLPFEISTCSSFELPPITGTNLNGSENYYSELFGSGSLIPVGTVFTSDTIIYISNTPNQCAVDKEIRITIEDFNAGIANNYEVCSSNGFLDLFDGILGDYTAGGTWTEQGSSLFDLTDPNQVAIPLGITPGVYAFAYTLTAPGCPITQTVSRVEIIEAPMVSNDSSATVCLGTTSLVLTDYISFSGQSTLVQFPLGTIFTSLTEYDISALTEGQYEFTVFVSNSNTQGSVDCTDSVKLDLFITSSPNAGFDIIESICPDTLLDLIDFLQGNTGLGVFEGPSVPLANGSILNTSDLTMTSNLFLHIIPAAGTCEADTSAIFLNIPVPPSAGADVDELECSLGQFDLTDYLTTGDFSGVFTQLSGIGTLNNNMIDINQEGSTELMYIVSNGCAFDTALLQLDFNLPSASSFTDQTCDTTYMYEGELFTPMDNSRVVSLNTTSGCDSMVDVTITFLEPESTNINTVLCPGDSIIVNGTVYNKDRLNGIERIMGVATNGCDSIVSIDLGLEDSSIENISIITCDENYSLQVGPDTYDINNPSGQTILEDQSLTGCDSIVNVLLEIELFNTVIELTQPECEEDKGMANLISFTGGDSLVVTLGGSSNQYDVSELPLQFELEIGSNPIEVTTINEECVYSDILNVEAPTPPSLDIVVNPLTGDTWQLGLDADVDITTYFWTAEPGTLSCWDCPDPILTGAATVIVIYDYGVACVGDTTFTVQTIKDNSFHLPNIISPNGDGLNDDFQIFTSEDNDIIIDDFYVYDRWGNQITGFSNRKPINGEVLWNGKFNNEELNPGVYVYLLRIDINGEKVIRKGDVTIIR